MLELVIYGTEICKISGILSSIFNKKLFNVSLRYISPDKQNDNFLENL